MSKSLFKKAIKVGIPAKLPMAKALDPNQSHAPRRKEILSSDEKKLAIRNALRYFPEGWHHELAVQSLRRNLEDFGRIYMHRFQSRSYEMYARLDQLMSTLGKKYVKQLG